MVGTSNQSVPEMVIENIINPEISPTEDPAVAALVPNMGSPCVQPKANPGQAREMPGSPTPRRWCSPQL